MAIEIMMPALSPTMEEGTLAKWLVREGDVVKSGQILAEIETDKATMEFEAVDEGTIGKILIAEGSAGVKVNTPIALLLEDGDSADAVVAAPKAAAPAVAAVAAPVAAAVAPAAAKPAGAGKPGGRPDEPGGRRAGRAADGTGQEADGLGGRLMGQAGWPTDRAADGAARPPSAARAAAQSWVGKLIEDSTVSFCEGQRVVTAFWRV